MPHFKTGGESKPVEVYVAQGGVELKPSLGFGYKCVTGKAGALAPRPRLKR
jgi:hypothetical protein